MVHGSYIDYLSPALFSFELDQKKPTSLVSMIVFDRLIGYSHPVELVRDRLAGHFRGLFISDATWTK